MMEIKIKLERKIYDMLLDLSVLTGHNLREIVAMYLSLDDGKPIHEFVVKLVENRVDYVKEKLEEYKEENSGGRLR